MPLPNLSQTSVEPLHGKLHNVKDDGFNSLSKALRYCKEYDDKVANILNLVLGPKLYKEGITPLDLLTSKGISKAWVADIRTILLDPGAFSVSAINNRLFAFSMMKKIRGLDREEYAMNISGRNELPKIQLFLLNEIYQISCLSLIEDGISLESEQLNRVFTDAGEFDNFVAAANETSIETRPSDKGGVRPRSIREAIKNCLIIRNMLNVYDTLASAKFLKATEDADIFIQRIEKTSARSLEVKDGKMSCRIEIGGAEGFSGTLYVDEKLFDAVNLKKWSNRKYGDTDSMNDLFRIRFEGDVARENVANKDKSNDELEVMDMRNISLAAKWFAHHTYCGKYQMILGEKGILFDHSLLPEHKKRRLKKEEAEQKPSTSVEIRLGDIVARTEGPDGRITDPFETQLQHKGEMQGWEAPEVYDFQKRLTKGARSFGSLSIYSVMLYVLQFPYDKVHIDGKQLTEEQLIDRIFNFGGIENNAKSVKEWNKANMNDGEINLPNTKSINSIWGPDAGFLLPVRVGEGIHFITKQSFSPDMFTLYPGVFIPAPLVKESVAYIRNMIKKTRDVALIELEDYHDDIASYREVRNRLLGKYLSEGKIGKKNTKVETQKGTNDGKKQSKKEKDK